MKRLLTITATLSLSVLALAGCSELQGTTSTVTGDLTNLYESPIKLNDGRELTCIIHSGGYQGGLSCDWANAR